MQLPTHFVTGVLIDKLVRGLHLPPPAGPLTTAAACYLSHGVLDKLARATYHPPDPLNDPFWKGYHHQILPAFTWFSVLWFGPRHWFAMLCSALPDLDWVVRGLTRRFGWSIPGWDKPILNEGLHAALDQVPLVRRLNDLPDLRHERKGVLVEAGLVALALGAIVLLDNKSRKR
jgi:hypothetical protein